MKGRIIGAIYCITSFAVAYLSFDGLLFNCQLMAWMIIAIAEIMVVRLVKEVDGAIWRKAPLAQILTLLLGIVACGLIEKESALLALLACYISDTAGFVFGKAFGRKKVGWLKHISPNKSYAGYAAGILIPIPCLLWLSSALHQDCLVFCILAGLAASLGDLLGSLTKRKLNLKDSGEILKTYPEYAPIELPLSYGHGGYLDRMDSVSVTTMLIFVALSL